MLHARLRGRQVHAAWPTLLLGIALACAAAPALAERTGSLAGADQLARGGDHAAAATMYESLARRAFGRWDTRVALLASREYLAAGRLDDAERMLGRAGERVGGDDAVLRARVSAELALARGRPTEAISALAALPEPWPAPLAAELLALRARAQFAAGRTLDGVRTVESRAAVVGTAAERRANYALIVDALRGGPQGVYTVPADADARERAWFELAALLAAGDADPSALPRQAADWRARHPHHPGVDFLPAPVTPGPLARGEAGAALSQAGTPGAIALLLPLSGRQQAAGTAVRDGFLAAVLAEPTDRRARIRLYDSAALGVVAAYQQALAEGAQAVAGPLTKDELALLVAGPPLALPTLALNSLAGGAPPAFLFQFALDPEQEARAAARRIAESGHSRGVALFPRSDWGDRVYQAFAAELEAAGVELTAAQPYEPSERDFSGPLRAALGRYGGAGDRDDEGTPVHRDPVAEARDGPQFAFLAASAPVARAIRPQLRFQMAYDLPVYATSDAWDPAARAVPDLDGLNFPEMPWILNAGAGAPVLWTELQAAGAGEARSRMRLYAFGFDAYHLLRGLDLASRGAALDGLTGRLGVAPDGRVTRELEWARVQGGRAEAAGAAQPPAASILPVEPVEP
jgi:hypothetical protein